MEQLFINNEQMTILENNTNYEKNIYDIIKELFRLLIKFIDNLKSNSCNNIIADDKTAPLPINAKFDNYDVSLKYIAERFNLDFDSLIQKITKGRDKNSPRIDKYDTLFQNIVTIHKHCY